MSTYLYYKIARAHQDEIASDTLNARRLRDLGTVTRARRSLRSQVSRAAAGLGICLAATTAMTVGAHASQPPKQHGTGNSASQLARDIRAFEAKGYVPWQCTPAGTLMRNSHGSFVTVRW
jgi:hypothetical protein